MKYLPMLAVKGGVEYLDSKKHIFEPKMDGTRCIAEIDEEIKLFNRSEKNITKRYPEIVRDLEQFKKVVFDGEIVCYNNGVPDFYRLQQREHIENEFIIDIRAKLMPATYIIFDILEINGEKIIDRPLYERKKILDDIFSESEHLELIYYTDNGHALWNEIKKRGLEGVMAKEKTSFYYPGERRKEWVKVKNLKSIDAIMVGYTSWKRKLSSIGMGLYDNGYLIYIGKVGTGFDEKLMNFIMDRIKKVDKPVVKNYEDAPPDMIWVKPELVIEVEYLEKTDKNELRSPSFKRIRMDKLPEECTIEQLK